MKHLQINDPRAGFHVLARTAQSEAATMSIRKGESEGGPDNQHYADQWLYVISGSGKAIVEGRQTSLEKGSLLLISAGERHEIRNTGRTTLKTLNVYSAPTF